MRKFIFLMILFSFCFLAEPANAVDNNDMKTIYNEQLESSGADKLFNALPKSVRDSLKEFDIESFNKDDLMKITPEKLFEHITLNVNKMAPDTFKTITMILAVILLSSIFSTLNVSIGEKSLSGVLNIVTVLCVCLLIVKPIMLCIVRASAIIKGASAFLFCYIPVMSGIMIASGQPMSSATYGGTMLIIGEILSQISSNFLVPVLNMLLSINIVSAVSSKVNLSSVCKLFSTIIKWVLGFFMSVFVGVLTLQSVVSVSSDSVSAKTMKFVLGSAVPIVGSALGDAFSTVQGCVKLLKSGLGAFFIIAIGFIFLPIIIECLLWTLCINFCVAASDIFNLNVVSGLLKSTGKVVGILMAIILCSATIVIISTTVVLALGSGNG